MANQFSFPQRVLEPIGNFLNREIKKLETRKKNLKKEDPFSNPARVTDSASPDTDAAEQFGHARVEAMRREVDRKLIAVRKALARIKIGKYGLCEDCGQMIDTDRLMVKPEATLCIKCERKREK